MSRHPTDVEKPKRPSLISAQELEAIERAKVEDIKNGFRLALKELPAEVVSSHNSLSRAIGWIIRVVEVLLWITTLFVFGAGHRLLGLLVLGGAVGIRHVGKDIDVRRQQTLIKKHCLWTKKMKSPAAPGAPSGSPTSFPKY